jgi:hypothetical protein
MLVKYFDRYVVSADYGESAQSSRRFADSLGKFGKCGGLKNRRLSLSFLWNSAGARRD